MANRFDDWEGDHLQHYGIQGMKWGIRRYQNPDGTLTSAGQKRYGEGSGHVSAGKLQRHFNRADQVYANAEVERRFAVKKAFKYGKKFTERGNKLKAKGKDPLSDRKTTRLMSKAKKAQEEANKYASQAKEAENLQRRIIDKVAKQGYTMSSKPVQRMAMTGRQFAVHQLFGAVGSITYMAMNSKMLTVGGMHAKVRAKGDGSIKLNSAPSNTDWLSDKDKAYAREQAGINNRDHGRKRR